MYAFLCYILYFLCLFTVLSMEIMFVTWSLFAIVCKLCDIFPLCMLFYVLLSSLTWCARYVSRAMLDDLDKGF